MATDRSQFKATSVASMKQQDKAVQQLVHDKGERTPWLKIDDGTNKFRIMPAHPDSTSFAYPCGRWWLQRDISYEKEGKTITERKKRPVFNAKIHGSAQKDIVEEYIKFAIKVLTDEISDGDELQKRIQSLTHWKTGLNLKPEWIVYAQKYATNGQKEFGLLSFPNGVKNKLNELAISEDDVNNPITTDPFTDVDNGKAIIIKYDKTEKQAKDVYKVNLHWQGNYALSDKELDEFAKFDSLNKLYHNVYKRKDFDIAVEGLRIFDEENEVGVFEHDEFIELVENMREEWPETDDSEDNDDGTEENETSTVSERAQVKAEKSVEKTIENKVIETEQDAFDTMNRLELKKYIKENNLSFMVKQSMTDDDIRNGIRTELSELEGLYEELPEELDEEVQEELFQSNESKPTGKTALD
ncbi:MAG TPA: hypothetical protein PKI46_02745, partial [Bacteroidales bacterium]|nr:hypothetical protein [Bacteroidales bacterium]